jgi:hypothetical protein
MNEFPTPKKVLLTAGLSSVACAILFVLVGAVHGEDAKLVELQDQLKRVKSDLLQAEQNAAFENDKVWKFKDQIVYSNETIKAVYLDMKKLEKMVLDKKQQVENEVMKLDAYRDLLKSRKDAYDKVRKLKDDEVHILQLIKNGEWRKDDSGDNVGKAEPKK